MNIALGLLALAVAPAEAAQPTAPASMLVNYRVKMIDMDGVSWRSVFHESLKPTTTLDAPNAWTIDSGSVNALIRSGLIIRGAPGAISAGDAHIAGVFKAGRPAHYYFLARQTRIADAPAGFATSLAYRPDVDKAECGWKVDIDGRLIDQGVIAKVKIEQNELIGMHTITSSEKLKSGNRFGASYQVPEFDPRRVDGEWLIPDGSALVATLGVRTVADEQGRAATRERIVVIEANRELGLDESEPRPVKPKAITPVAAIVPPVVSTSIIAMPALPSRSLPEPIGTDGKPFPLPPLPADPETEIASNESSEARPSPQAPRAAVKASSEIVRRDRDDEAVRTEYKLGPNGLFVKMDKVAVQPLKPNIFRIPIGANLAIEIRTSVVPNPAKEGCDAECSASK